MNKLKNFLGPFLIACCVLFSVATAAFVFTGCSSTPQATAYKTSDAVITTADQAIAAWSDFVVKRQVSNAAITDPILKAEAQHTLLVNEGHVSEAYATYQQAARAAVMLGSSATGSSGAVDIAAATTSFIAVVTQLLKQ